MVAMSSDDPEFARHAQRGLRGGLREIAGGSRLVVDGHDFRLGTGKQLDFSGGRLAAEGGEQSGLALEDGFRSARAGLGQLDRGNRIARGETGMEIHLGAAGARPFVQAGRCVGGNGHRAGRGVFAKAERTASRQRGAERRHKAGRPVKAGEVGSEQRAADLRAGLVADDGGGKERRAG